VTRAQKKSGKNSENNSCVRKSAAKFYGPCKKC